MRRLPLLALVLVAPLAACTPTGPSSPTDSQTADSVAPADLKAFRGVEPTGVIDDIGCDRLRAEVLIDPLVEGTEASRCLSVAAANPQGAADAVANWLIEGTDYRPADDDAIPVAPAGLGSVQLSTGSSIAVIRTVPDSLRRDYDPAGGDSVLVTAEVTTFRPPGDAPA